MMTIKIEVNNGLIELIDCVNVVTVSDGLCAYDYVSYDRQNKQMTKGQVYHNREDGIHKLVSIIMQDIDKKKEKEGQ